MVPKPFRRMVEPHPFFTEHFLPLFGPDVRQLYPFAVIHESPQQYFIAKTSNCTRNFPTLHPLAGLSRYDWFVVGATDTSPLGMPKYVRRDTDAPLSIRLGWLRDEQALGIPSLDQKQQFEADYAGKLNDLLPKYRRLRQLQQTPAEKLTPAEKQELHDLTTLVT